MKKLPIILLLSALGLASCVSTPIASSNGDGKDSSASSSGVTSSSDIVAERSAAEVYHALKEAGQGNNFTLSYNWTANGVTTAYTNVQTDKYSYYDYTKGRYVLLPSSETPPIRILYQILRDKNGNDYPKAYGKEDASGNILPLKSTRDGLFNYFLDFADEAKAYSEADLAPTEKAGVYHVSDSGFYGILAKSIGLSYFLYYSGINGADLSLLSDGSLRFVLTQPSAVSAALTLPESDRTGIIAHIGSAKDDDLEKIYESFTLPEETLTQEAIDALHNATAISANSHVTLEAQKDYSVSEVGTMKIETKGDFYHSLSDQGADEDGNPTAIERTFKIKEDGKAYYGYLDATNKVTEIDSTFTKDTLPFPTAMPLSSTDFRKEKNGFYGYYGFNARPLLDAVSNLNFPSYVTLDRIQMEVQDGKISRMIFTSSALLNSDDNQYYRYIIDTSFAYEANFSTANFFECGAVEGKTDKIATALDYFKKADSTFAITATDSADGKETLLRTSDVYVSIRDTSAGVYATGYKDLGNGTYQPFEISNGTLKQTKLPVSGTLYDAYKAKVDIDARVLSLADDGATIAANEAVEEIPNHFLLGYKLETWGLLAKTLSLTLKDGKIVSGSADYPDVSGKKKGSVTLAYQYPTADAPIAFPEQYASLKTLIDGIKATEGKSSWKEESETFYKSLVAIYGEETAKAIPYYYSEEASGNFATYTGTAAGKKLVLTNNAGTPKGDWKKTYAEGYGKMLEEAGYTKSQGEDEYDTVYTSGEVKITIRYKYMMASAITLRLTFEKASA